MMPARLFVADALVAGQLLALPAAAARHVQVLRLQPGQPVVVFNGDDDAEWPAQITRIGRSSVDVRLGERTPVDRELPIRVCLAVGIPANERMDALVEKATELGAAAIQPLLCERSVVRLAGDRAEARRRHWSAVAASACEQSGRVRLPRIAAPLPFDAWLRELDAERNAAPPAARRVVLSLAAGAVSPAAWQRDGAAAAAADVVVLSGPEGGLAPGEEAAALALAFERVSLGSRVLRADTAPLAWLAWLACGVAATRR